MGVALTGVDCDDASSFTGLFGVRSLGTGVLKDEDNWEAEGVGESRSGVAPFTATLLATSEAVAIAGLS